MGKLSVSTAAENLIIENESLEGEIVRKWVKAINTCTYWEVFVKSL